MYVEYVLQGKTDMDFDSKRKNYFERIRDSLRNWENIRNMLIGHAKKINAEFKPYAYGFSLLSNYLTKDDLAWLQDVVNAEYSLCARLDKWVEEVVKAINRVDEVKAKIKSGTSGTKELRSAVDELMEVYSGRGYFNYAEGN